MGKLGLWPAILRFVRNVGIAIVFIFVLAGLSCLPAVWRTFYHLGNRVMLLGVLAILVGAACTVGNTATAGDLEYLMPTGSNYQRAKQRLVDSMSSHRFTIAIGIAGGIALFLGDLVRRAGLSAMGLP